ncbi:DPP IV N-terminal domain-containing protein [Marinicella sediminis]|uniref:DPP IV N-terminal domain-containing protein n=1 Tax=Marinicella sediminis TaxID=1792834 RepID=A0ABV7J8G0_9GAMM|nr:S9 family peptidase [Marinicella sediminis]
MKPVGLLLMTIMTLTVTEVNAEQLTLERIFASPDLAGPKLRALKMSPDGVRVTYLQGKINDKDQFDLWEYHIKDRQQRILVDSDELLDGEEQLSAEEKARRERQRLANVSGIIDYAWSKDGQFLLFPLNGDLYVYQLADQSTRQITRTDAFETDARFSPKGRYVSFIRQQNLFVVDAETGQEQQLTQDGGGLIKNGMAEFVAQEEMKRNTGYWWSPDEQYIAFLQVDESPVEVTKRYEINADDIEVIEQRYPYTGQPNVSIRMGLVKLTDGAINWVDLGNEADIYVARVDWLKSAQEVSYQWQSRDQQTLKLQVADLTGKSRTLITERSDTWINLHDDLTFLHDGRFIWASERSGHKHLYLYSAKGEVIHPLTKGEWVVDELTGLDESAGWVYFTGALDTPLEKHLYRVALNEPAQPEKITSRSGFHEISMDDSARYYIDQWSDREHPPQTSLHRSSGERLAWLNQNAVGPGHPYYPYLSAHLPNEFGHIKVHEGTDQAYTLHYRMIKPADFDPAKKYPVFQYVYGGPHVQYVTRSWGRLIEQYMAQQGFLVFVIDNRGSDRRGVVFESALYKRMGTPELEDQVAGTRYLKSLPFVDAEKVGIFGWSYGGFMTLKALTKAADEYALGVSVAPVTDFALYDTHYTERYMSTPQLNPEGYRTTAVFADVSNITKPLLLIHGMADDNVLFLNSTKLIKVLQDEGVLFDTMIYPGGKHGISGEKPQFHVYSTIARFFIKHLQTTD